MATVCAGDMRHRVVVERFVQTDDGAGGWVNRWFEHAIIWCAIRNPSGRERMENQRLISETAKVFSTRFGVDIVETDRLVFRDRLYNIRWLRNEETQDRILRIYADGGVVPANEPTGPIAILVTTDGSPIVTDTNAPIGLDL